MLLNKLAGLLAFDLSSILRLILWLRENYVRLLLDLRLSFFFSRRRHRQYLYHLIASLARRCNHHHLISWILMSDKHLLRGISWVILRSRRCLKFILTLKMSLCLSNAWSFFFINMESAVKSWQWWLLDDHHLIVCWVEDDRLIR